MHLYIEVKLYMEYSSIMRMSLSRIASLEDPLKLSATSSALLVPSPNPRTLWTVLPFRLTAHNPVVAVTKGLCLVLIISCRRVVFPDPAWKKKIIETYHFERIFLSFNFWIKFFYNIIFQSNLKAVFKLKCYMDEWVILFWLPCNPGYGN